MIITMTITMNLIITIAIIATTQITKTRAMTRTTTKLFHLPRALHALQPQKSLCVQLKILEKEAQAVASWKLAAVHFFSIWFLDWPSIFM